MPTFVPLSACTSAGATSRCAIEPDQCPAGFSFELDNVSLFSHITCNNVEAFETGRCDDTGRCAYNADECKDPSTYQDPNVMGPQGCTVALDSDSGQFVRHSKCERDGVTLCHAGDCSDGVMTYHHKGCHCGAVWTGACYDESSGKHFCAVDKSSCTSTTVFRNAHDLWRAEDIDCRLCSTLYYEHPGAKEISPKGAFGLGFGFGAIPVFILAVCYMKCCRRTGKTVEDTPEAEMS